MSLKRQEQSSVYTVQSPSFARQVIQSNGNDDIQGQNSYEIGSIYEIDHTQLPTRTPLQLRSIRVVIVSEKAEKNVTVRYPSLESLSKYFGNRVREIFPCLEEKFTMGTKLASKVLYREVSSKEFAENMKSECFWLVNPVPEVGGVEDLSIPKKDTGLTSVLKSGGMLTWGVRRQVKFLGKHREINTTSSFVSGGGKVKLIGYQKQEADGDHEEKEAEAEEEEEEEMKVEVEEEDEEGDDDEDDNDDDQETQKNLKRKHYSFRSYDKVKEQKSNKQNQNIYYTKCKNKCKKMVLKNPIDRWSTQRYKAAEKNLLEVMKAKEAVFGNPILRPALRMEARKRIGDTGLLDHLLKHMAGKVAPGGNERFRRRHNADGAMEYWLESADLVNIRKEAGVQDPYWTPPPGWKLGDCPTQDPMCVKEFKILKDQTSNIRREMEESKKQLEEEVTRLRREMEELVSMKKMQKGISQAIMVPNPADKSISTHPTALIKQLEKYKKQLLEMSNSMRRMEEEIGRLKTSKVGEETKEASMELSGEEKRNENKMIKLKELGKRKAVEEPVVAEPAGAAEPEQVSLAVVAPSSVAVAVAEEKAEKIKRLRSGFRLCKPQGTFLWPNSTSTNSSINSNIIVSPQQQVVVQVEDHFVIPTPPSVSSSSVPRAPFHPYNHHHHPASPVKPLAERRAVTVTVSTNAPNHPYVSGGGNTYSTTNFNNNPAALINLNDIPASPAEGGGGGGCVNVKSPPSSAAAATATARAAVATSSSASNNGVETWLALATPNPKAAGSANTSRGW